MIPELTLRDYFAAKAMQGYLSSFSLPQDQCPEAEDFAYWAYELADAMIEERKPGQIDEI